MKKTFLAALVFFGMVTMGHATPIDVDFYRISSNSTSNIASQLDLKIYDSVDALATYSITLTEKQFLFAFTNNIGIASNVAEIYIDNGPITAFNAVYNNLGTTLTNFTVGAVTPGNLPGGNTLTPNFIADTMFSADSENGSGKGIDQATDVLGIVYTVPTGLSAIESQLLSGDLRIGMHVRSQGTDGQSDAYVNVNRVPVPEPTTMLLLGLGLVGLAGARRKFKK
jgi:hypothetical protein